MAALLRSKDTRRARKPFLWRPGLLMISGVLFLVAVLWASAGCGGDTPSPTPGPAAQLGYINRSGDSGKLLITTTAGGEGDSLLEWRGYGERFSFANDGRYFTMTLWGEDPGRKEGVPPRHRFFIASTDGERAYHLTSRADLLSFSPDSTRVAYVTMPESGPNEVGILDVTTGEEKTLARGEGLLNPFWVDNNTVMYTQLNGSTVASRSAGGVIYRVDVKFGEPQQMTPAGRLFSTYGAPVSYDRPQIALIERGELNNVWSLDAASGQLRQITNNNLFHLRAGYLPGTNRILFQEERNSQDTMSSELCLMADDGSEFNMLTSNFIFDGLQSFSVSGDRIAYQQTGETGGTSIWTMNANGSSSTRIAGSETAWLGDPNFLMVPGWRGKNPIEMSVAEGAPGEAMKVTLRNTADHPVETVLRAFPGIDLKLTPVSGQSSDAHSKAGESGGAPAAGGLSGAGPELTWNLQLAAGETIEVGVDATLRPTFAPATEAALLFTLAVPGTPPRMFWKTLS